MIYSRVDISRGLEIGKNGNGVVMNRQKALAYLIIIAVMAMMTYVNIVVPIVETNDLIDKNLKADEMVKQKDELVKYKFLLENTLTDLDSGIQKETDGGLRKTKRYTADELSISDEYSSKIRGLDSIIGRLYIQAEKDRLYIRGFVDLAVDESANAKKFLKEYEESNNATAR
jgi:hypothetical protein